ncbi:MAG: hypothetical protein EOR68_13090 [Mesorhizobium sp.]|uniref:hypothetical protein n=1 Tax=Mesorhizobium sp. TaxID=1871066 RepID=UPI000FE98244|nr:hypothetical protein [Mesorhizobium sp.]RWL99756.1 MAG: hypothetical protein EOR68_13090 [Mesorhizobium sp.]
MIFFADIENFFSYGDISQEEFDNPSPVILQRACGKRINWRADALGLFQLAPQRRPVSIMAINKCLALINSPLQHEESQRSAMAAIEI